ncbi:hypothetical protein SAMN04487911_1546 [Arenibacter nanhaiticus]|uniref:Uncharacterized protein n=1 Tax=Arenibacter nanhaiticus TaxID=558155 RepID=A0A1M6N396_9FLAO|nr:hypothetical protein SAMN04487911_1546 [Arenibacter nanhaiticus]
MHARTSRGDARASEYSSATNYAEGQPILKIEFDNMNLGML